MKKETTKRRDNKGRILKNGESQRKDGRYVYKYVDLNGKDRYVYSWKLASTDRLPKGKRECIALRDMEEEIRKDMSLGINSFNSKMIFIDYVKEYYKIHDNVRYGTKVGRNYLVQLIEKYELGNKKVKDIKVNHVKQFLKQAYEDGYSKSTLKNHKRSLKCIFADAISNDLMVKNPADFNINEVIGGEIKRKYSLTKEELSQFLESAEIYLDEYKVLLLKLIINTGIRYSELYGLTKDDIDLEKKEISINKQLNLQNGKKVIAPLKTKKSERIIPMTEECYEICKKIYEFDRFSIEEVNDIKGFICCKRNKRLYYHSELRYDCNYIVEFANNELGYNLPKVTPHILRHTFCTIMANNKMTPNNLQYIMGHADVTMTLGYYSHGGIESAKDEISSMNIY